MKIVNFNPDGEWLEIDVVSKVSSGIFKVKVIPISINAEFRLMKYDLAGYVSDMVVDWNLNVDGKDVPCDDESKKRWVPVISKWEVGKAKYQDKKFRIKNVGAEIIAFAQDVENFTKNSKPTSN